MRVLLTNNTLSWVAGSELYLLDVATALRDRGHQPVCFSTLLGPVAARLRKATIPVVDDLGDLAEPPDVIHGQHHLETMTALLRFPGVPAVYVCHGFGPWQEAPPRFPRIRRYVAVSHATRDRLTLEHGIPEGRIRLLLNSVDLTRFQPRGPLPSRPRRALVLSNQASPTTFFLAVEEACRRAGLVLDAVGAGMGTATDRPEAVLPDHDLVFAYGRSALEAMAVGAAVVLCDAPGLGPMVTSAELDRLRVNNFGSRVLTAPVDVDGVLRQIERYDAADATEVSRAIRSTAGRDAAVETLIGLYGDVIAEQAGSSDPPEADLAAASGYLRWLGPFLKREMAAEVADAATRADEERCGLQLRVEGLTEDVAAARAEAHRIAQHVERLYGDVAAARADRDRLANEHLALQKTCERVSVDRARLEGLSERLQADRARIGAERDALAKARDRLERQRVRRLEHEASLEAERAERELESARLADEHGRLVAELEALRAGTLFRLRERALGSRVLRGPTRLAARMLRALRAPTQ